jgi:hypothetical protein
MMQFKSYSEFTRKLRDPGFFLERPKICRAAVEPRFGSQLVPEEFKFKCQHKCKTLEEVTVSHFNLLFL